MTLLRVGCCWGSVWLLSAAGCGRIGVHALPLDPALPPIAMDAGIVRDAGQPGGYMQGGGGGAISRDAGRASAGADGSTAPDAAMPLDAGMPAPATCSGQTVFGLCWYLAAEDTSCSAECASKGGFDTRALSYVGTPSQGGSAAECMQILGALGRSGSVVQAVQQIGLGCHVWNNGTLYWLQSPAFSASVAAPSGTGARIVCACQR